MHPHAAAKICKVVSLFAAMAENQNYSRPNLNRVGLDRSAKQLESGRDFCQGTLLGTLNAEDDGPIKVNVELYAISESEVGLMNEANFLKGDAVITVDSAKDSADRSNIQGASSS